MLHAIAVSYKNYIVVCVVIYIFVQYSINKLETVEVSTVDETL